MFFEIYLPPTFFLAGLSNGIYSSCIGVRIIGVYIGDMSIIQYSKNSGWNVEAIALYKRSERSIWGPLTKRKNALMGRT
jgi:hypothetical protein